jgi:hypothetical protein
MVEVNAMIDSISMHSEIKQSIDVSMEIMERRTRSGRVLVVTVAMLVVSSDRVLLDIGTVRIKIAGFDPFSSAVEGEDTGVQASRTTVINEIADIRTDTATHATEKGGE